MRFSSFKTPYRWSVRALIYRNLRLTVQNGPLSDHLLHVILSLGEDEEYVGNAALANLSKLSFLVKYSAENQR